MEDTDAALRLSESPGSILISSLLASLPVSLWVTGTLPREVAPAVRFGAVIKGFAEPAVNTLPDFSTAT